MIDPFDNLALSAVVAVVPILIIFWALIIKKLKVYQASLLAMIAAFIIALFIYKMPVQYALLSIANGALYGLFPICWIIIAAVFLFNVTVKSGQFKIIKHFMASISSDRRIQALLIAFSFGSFLEGTAGFGAPVAITAAMLTGLGFNPLYAAGICLIANTAPVAFGSIGIPITVASQVTSIPEMAISQMVGRTLPFLSVFIPFYLVMLMSGFKKTMEVFWPVMVSGVSFSLLQFLSSNFLGPYLPDIIAGIGSIIILIIFLRFWNPASTWRFENEPPATLTTEFYSNAAIVKAWSPFILLTVMVIAWGIQPVKDLLNNIGSTSFAFPGLHNNIQSANGEFVSHLYKFNYLSAAGTAIFVAALFSIPVTGMSYKQAGNVFKDTLSQLKYPIITITTVLGFAYLVNDSGITGTMATVLANTGMLFPFFAPMLGWLGVFITGSDTSANALFGKLQATTATSIGVDPVVTISANVSGGVVGKMISPQSIAVAAAAGRLTGKEAALFRFTVKHSFIMLLFICVIVLLQAYVFKAVIPSYTMLTPGGIVAKADVTTGLYYLVITFVLIVVFVSFLRHSARRGKS